MKSWCKLMFPHWVGLAAVFAFCFVVGTLISTINEPMKPSIGRIVHVVIDNEGTHRPAVIVQVGIGETIEARVFYAIGDSKLIRSNSSAVDNVLSEHDETATRQWSWHWPER